jgi:hypothetical protein
MDPCDLTELELLCRSIIDARAGPHLQIFHGAADLIYQSFSAGQLDGNIGCHAFRRVLLQI